ncbi:hypothetical protein [Polyangium sp. y55x31]|uniref:hypothetical protein n=1 Tax=Polyangium sp. y55x31 TaxID=3042688 RepID=UPI0024826FD8|nr:hypothetical protein [Polyangium sp. y55x31]MDI1483281.1 hypothetical protein [Polyangium sp. y55x31]
MALRDSLKRSLWLWLATAACGTAEPPAPPATSPPEPADAEAALPAIGAATRLLSGAEHRAVVTRGAYAYVADVDGLSVYVVDTSGRIALEHHVPTPGTAQDLTFAGPLLYLADGLRGVASFDLDSPERPRLLGHTAVPGAARRVIGSELGVAVLHERAGLTVLRPGHAPEHLALPGNPKDAAWVGSHLYVADAGDGLLRVDLEPGPPHVAFRERAFRRATSLAARGSLLVVGSQDKHVRVLDTSASPPRVLAEVTLDHAPARLDVLGSQVLAAGGGATLLDLSASGSIEVRTPLPFAVLGAAALGPSLVLAARGAEGLELLHTSPGVGARARVPGSRLDRVAASDAQVMTFGEDGTGAWIWPLDPGARATELPGVRIRDAVFCGRAVCTLDPKGNLCQTPLPVRPAASPVCKHVPEGGRSIAWQPSAGTLWLLDEAGGLQGFRSTEGFTRVAAVSRPPTTTQEKLTRLAVEGERAVAIDPELGLLQVFDLGPTPRRRGFYVLQAPPAAVAFVEGTALVAEPSAGVQVVDVTDPDRPRELSWVPLEPRPQGISVWHPEGRRDRARVAVAHGEGGVSLWAWDGRGAFDPMGRSDTSGLASDVVHAGGSLWVADGAGAARFVLPAERP